MPKLLILKLLRKKLKPVKPKPKLLLIKLPRKRNRARKPGKQLKRKKEKLDKLNAKPNKQLVLKKLNWVKKSSHP